MLLFVPMSTLDPMVAPRALVLSLSSPLMMPVMPFNNSTAMTGKVAPSRFVRIVSLALVLDSVDEAALEVAVASEVGLVDVEEALEAVEDLAADSAAVVEAFLAVTEELLAVVSMLELLLPLPILSPTMLRLAPREARRSTFAT